MQQNDLYMPVLYTHMYIPRQICHHETILMFFNTFMTVIYL